MVAQLLDLRQGSQSASHYALEFRILAAESGWGDLELQTIFRRGLGSDIQDELAVREESQTLNQLIELAIKLDNRIQERGRERQEARRRRPLHPAPPLIPEPAISHPTPRAPPPEHDIFHTEEPMQLGRACLTPAERRRRLEERRCLYCGERGHFISLCTARPKGEAHHGRGGPW